MKCIGSFVARFFIKIVKSIEPGFISGYNEQEVASRIHEQLISSQNLSYNIAYSYDGSGHDAHQHAPLIEAVDN